MFITVNTDKPGGLYELVENELTRFKYGLGIIKFNLLFYVLTGKWASLLTYTEYYTIKN